MLENYDALQRIRELAAEWERDHARSPYADDYARGCRRAFAALADPLGPERAEGELRGVLDAVLSVVEEIGLESAQILLGMQPDEP
ncbi:MAG TPA: hypothetical protein VK689_05095 [Armatimonadota bacterium]|nr:hypothetical protein [Armatimonadota bacterium]